MQLTETTGLLPFLQEPATFPCSEQDESCPFCSVLSPEDPFKCCAQCTRMSSKWFHAFGFSNQNPLCISLFYRCLLITLTFDTVSSELLNSSLNINCQLMKI